MRMWAKLALGALVMAGLGEGAMAADAAGQATVAVAVVRIQEVFRNSDYAKLMEAQIKASFTAEERELDDLQKMMKAEQDKLQGDALMDPNSYAYKEKVMKFQMLELKFQDRRANYQKISRAKMATFWRSVYADFRMAVKQIASTGRYLVIETAPDVELSEDSARSNAPEMVMNEILQRRVQYVAPAVDLTDQVVQVMNQINQQRGTSR